MSSSSALTPRDGRETTPADGAPGSPARNPSYPARQHFGEKPQLESALRSWDEKIAGVERKLAILGSADGHRATYEQLYHQMLGARDQMADAVRRMPLETGTLYEEDRERLKTAEAALARVLRRWDAVGR